MVRSNRNIVCYILAPSYSGSTLLALLLNTHPRIATVGELNAPRRIDTVTLKLCSCGQPLNECSFWHQVGSELEGRNQEFDTADLGTRFESHSGFPAKWVVGSRIQTGLLENSRETLLYGLPVVRRELDRILERNHLLIETIIRVQGGTILIDSSKNANRLKLMHRSGYWRIRVINLIRDGRGTTNSFMKKTEATMKKAATLWIRSHEQTRRVLKCLPRARSLRIRYEDLANQPADTLGRISGFLGLDDRRFRLDFRSAEHHLLGNSMRLEETTSIALDSKWQKELSATDLEDFHAIAGRLNQHLGYGANRPLPLPS